MKLTEQQLQKLFQDNSQNNNIGNQTPSNAGDCLLSADASNQRLQQAETLLNDFTSAQAMKATFALKGWSAQVAQSVQNQSVSSWFNWISHPFKATATACAFALAVFIALPNFTHNEEQVQALHAHNDIISSTTFESDVLSSGSFDGSIDDDKDSLFDGSFG